jgi:hypothetical protein
MCTRCRGSAIDWLPSGEVDRSTPVSKRTKPQSPVNFYMRTTSTPHPTPIPTPSPLFSCLRLHLNASSLAGQVRDPRVDHSDNDSFLDMMEDYFGRDPNQKASETRPELSFQVIPGEI